MSNITKQDILDAIRQTAKANGGKPLGSDRFAHETGIKPYDWKKYWSRLGDAQKEAGFEPNKLQQAFSDEFIFKKIFNLIRKLKKFPTYGELIVERHNNAEFPHHSCLFETKVQKQNLAVKIIEWCKGKKEYDDIVQYCMSVIEEYSEKENVGNTDSSIDIGEVYLFKSGHYYKIGKTIDTVRRGMEIRIQLPERTDLIHSIKTDDPSGIEAYWHNRFKEKRKEGEWFDLKPSDVKAFKRWRRIV